ncbi:aminotransferase class I/II-fold pyridoxal phosphate-dependent enzyme [Lacticaseibacillus thailandensis]|uniref:Aminotransferase n=1 Tax=Lacticaseibacillus thailandensis DSM 22698 = JCM 13996 TaxID=1423810 RepID=A0A0R2C5E5_9LACO|nr:aminotransferase class I/II-fold pyridoxal phosphate-dependent enzyme [Lacticaseibacillus thailandensis]KRM86554.1 aspartate aminotransferase [Lacticaseibacillus thailandensis DSM 22698 = JCM 13996]
MPELKSSITGLGNQALSTVPPSAIRAVDNKISNIPGIIKLTLGEPDFAVPEHIKEATKAAIDANWSHYAPSFGYLELREQISQYLADRFDAHYQADGEVVVTVGATEAIFATIRGLFNPGDTIIVPTPEFPLYANVAAICGLNVVTVSTAPEFVLTPARLRATLAAHPEAKAIVLNYPNNPTGATYTHEQVRAVAQILADTDLVVLSDEIYAELTYREDHISMGHLLPEQTILISGFSKSHAMTGYRVGYVAGPAALIKLVGKMHQFLVTTAASPMMKAAEEALRHGRTDGTDMRDIYRQRRDLIMGALSKAGFTAPTPAGAFYVFAKIPATMPQDDVQFVYDLAERAKVGVVPGSVFGPGGEGYIRLSYAASTENLEEAGRRIQAYAADLVD